jgi:hypothetical protein
LSIFIERGRLEDAPEEETLLESRMDVAGRQWS